MDGHIAEGRVWDVLKGTGAQFSEEELKHLANCEQCGKVLAVFRETIREEAKGPPKIEP